MSFFSRVFAYIVLIASILVPQLTGMFRSATPDSIRTYEVRASIENGEDAHIYELRDENVVFAQGDNFYYVNNVIVVFFADGVSDLKKAEITASVGGKCIGYNEIVDVWQIRVDEASFEELDKICEKLKKYTEVDNAVVDEADIIRECAIPDDPWGGYAFSESLPNGYNWWIEATQCLSAWDYNEYFHHIDVGVVDNGIFLEHEDISSIELVEEYAGNNRPSGHGSAVSSLIGATPNNKKGLTGILWDTTIHTVDVFPDSDQDFQSTSMIYWGLISCVSAGAKVVNFSLGHTIYSTSIPTEATINRNAATTSSYMARLLNNGYDFIVVQSAGNGFADTHASYDTKCNGYFCSINENNTGYSAEMAKKINDRIVIAAAAENCENNVYEQAVTTSWASCVGDNVDICAPGRKVYSTQYTSDNVIDSYAQWNGTSMAAPITAGILALTWSVNPSLTGPEVRSIVLAEENTPYLVSDNTSSLHPQVYEYRMVNAKCSVEAALNTLPADYTAVDEAIEAVNALDLSIYTPLSVQRVTDAVAAVDRTKTLMEQDEVDQMAEDINYAVSRLVFRPPTIAPAEGSDVYIDRENKLIYCVEERTTVDALAQQLTVTNGTIDILTSSRFVGTGSIVDIYHRNGELYSSYEVIIFGDLDGNGIINSSDYAEFLQYFVDGSNLGDRNSPYYIAADLTPNGRLTLVDLALLNGHIVGDSPIDQKGIR